MEVECKTKFSIEVEFRISFKVFMLEIMKKLADFYEV